MADLSALGALKPVEPLNLENYVVNRKAKFQLPPKGRYTVQAPDSFPAESFTRSNKSGALGVEIGPTIVGGAFDGFKIRYQRVYATTWVDKKSGKTVSGIGNYLAANGVKGVLSDEQALADAVESTAGRTYEVLVDWKIDKNGVLRSGMENFPVNEDGTHQSYIDSLTEKDEEGRAKRIFANLDIVFFVPAAA